LNKCDCHALRPAIVMRYVRRTRPRQEERRILANRLRIRTRPNVRMSNPRIKTTVPICSCQKVRHRPSLAFLVQPAPSLAATDVSGPGNNSTGWPLKLLGGRFDGHPRHTTEALLVIGALPLGIAESGTPANLEMLQGELKPEEAAAVR
jgi:hypothetical protein